MTRDLFAPLRRGPAYAQTPLVISVPHAGRFYPEEIAAARAVPQRVIEELEDRHADLLIGAAVGEGAVAIVAQCARAWIDLNRAPVDDGEGRHARGGLGLIPTRLGGQLLWRTPPDADARAARVAVVHRPYHAAIAAALAEARALHGFALLIDCHSMPPIRRGPGAGAALVIGDRHGRSADRMIIDAVAAAAQARSLSVSRNAPYAGAYTIEHHGIPERRCDALQLEWDRSLYLRQGLREPNAGISAIAQHFAALCRAAIAAAERPPLLDAAE
ncbi:N-formylglutamate amidohydrolase [Sphingomonas vulcanisoli]|uniref:N-formylglutamate amidohydrolase n=1 Tax=Sphingomonas vulcanisoli TaxID=1658060 RepID=A0ABX0TVC4_9SPHN|nr:N-formylglutamate amidohydrolase [Sphingomonas vulcanisoli]NIJ09488.1 N-formylglutamate amidohydrolase [Sphingomonas vulcanisoli]